MTRRSHMQDPSRHFNGSNPTHDPFSRWQPSDIQFDHGFPSSDDHRRAEIGMFGISTRHRLSQSQSQMRRILIRTKALPQALDGIGSWQNLIQHIRSGHTVPTRSIDCSRPPTYTDQRSRPFNHAGQRSPRPSFLSVNVPDLICILFVVLDSTFFTSSCSLYFVPVADSGSFNSSV